MGKCACGKERENSRPAVSPEVAAQSEAAPAPKSAHKCGCGGKCGCGRKGKRRGIRTEQTPPGVPDDFSEGRPQLGLRGK